MEQTSMLVALNKREYLANKYFLFLNKNICCGYSLEVPH